MCDNMRVHGDAPLEELPELLGGFQVGLAASVSAEGASYWVNIVFSYPGSKKTTGQINSRGKKKKNLSRVQMPCVRALQLICAV